MADFFFTGEPITREDYARLLLTRLQAASPRPEVELDSQKGTLCLKWPHRHQRTQILSLNNLHADYLQASQDKRSDVLARQVAWSLYLPPDDSALDYATDVRPRLLPIVGGRGRCLSGFSLDEEFRQTEVPRRRVRLPHVALGRDHSIYLVRCPDGVVESITDTRLALWGISFEQALSDAIATLRTVVTPQWERMEGGFFKAAWNDGYNCSLLLLPEVFAELPLRGNPVAVVAARGDLFVTDEFNREAQWAMLQEARQRLEVNHDYCAGSLVVLSQGQTWVRFETPDARVRQAEKNLVNLIDSEHYRRQKEWLSSEVLRQRQLVLVTNVMMRTDPEGNVENWSLIAQGIPALIPKTDLMVFISEDAHGQSQIETAVHVPWDDGMVILGALLEPCVEDVYPPRFRICDFPDEATLQRLRAKAVVRS